MTTTWRLAGMAACVATSLALAGLNDAPREHAAAKQGRVFVMCLAEGRFADAEAMYDQRMKRAMAGKTAETWRAIENSSGAFRQIAAHRVERQGAMTSVYVTCRFAGGSTIDVQVVLNAQGRVAGLWFRPSGPAKPYTPPAYVDRDRFDEVELTAKPPNLVGLILNEPKGRHLTLPGTVSMPKEGGPFPLVVLVHGSGPNDRDESVGGCKPFRDLAWGLASRGVAVVRYDKRSFAAARGKATPMTKATIDAEVVDDAVKIVEEAASLSEVDPKRVYVAGHSLGGYLAPRIAARAPQLAGVIILAGSTRPMEDLIVDQVAYLTGLDGEVTDEERNARADLAVQAKRVKAPEAELAKTPKAMLPMGVPAEYWLSMREYDAVAVAARLPQRILIVQGGRDYQVTKSDYEGWRATLGDRPNVTMAWRPKLNHLFVAGDGLSTPSEYQRAGHVDGRVIDLLANWLHASKPRP